MGATWLGLRKRGVPTDGAAKRCAGLLEAGNARICVLIPCRNEVRHIEATLESVLAQTFPRKRMEIVVVDGMSNDGTRELLVSLAARHTNLRMLDNPGGKTPCALNIGIASTTADIVVRVDAHCFIAPDYVWCCVEVLCATGAANVGGLMRPRAENITGNAIALALRSRFGVGNGRFHYLERLEYVDTVYLGSFRREVLLEMDGFDEELVRNQDDELNFRIRDAGYGVLLSPDVVSSYAARGTHHAVWRQYFQYGFWKVRVIHKHPRSAQPKHLAPVALVGGLIGSLSSFELLHQVWLLLPVVLYLSLTLLASAIAGRRKPASVPLLATVFPCLHLAYGVGFLLGILNLGMRLASRNHSPRSPRRTDEGPALDLP
ncbi:MAG: glycosyltransferase family 2 protein [Chloroflexota bacterium]|nr:glycosyltransferase family 2 protein [Chloroflexota bacterium]